MSEDLKAKFRAAAAQRGLNSAKDQLKAIKAQKAAVAAAAAGPGPSSQRLQQQQQQQKPVTGAGSQGRPAGGAAIPADFFQQAPKASAVPGASGASAVPASAVVPAAARPAPATVSAAPGPSSQALAQRPPASTAAGPAAKPAAATAGPGAATSALPQGFFADKAADAQARGVKLPTAADREADFRAFTELIDEELKQQAANEADAAEEEAEEKADREAFLLRRQQERLELLRHRKALLLSRSAGDASTSGAPGTAAAPTLPDLPPDEELREAPAPKFWSDDEEEKDGKSGDEAGQGPDDAGPGAGEAADATAPTAAREASPGTAGAGSKRPRRALPVLAGKRRRVIDALAATMGVSDGEGASSSSGGEESEGVGSEGGAGGLNWRAKRV